MIRLGVVLFALSWGQMLAAQEHISTTGALSDRDFYRLVACAADPGGTCRKQFVRWPARKARTLTVGIARVDPTFPKRKAALIDTALTEAAARITGVGAGVAISRSESSPDIVVHLMDHPEQSPLKGTNVPGLDGNFIEAAHVHVWWNGAKEITASHIVITHHIRRSGIRSVILEELVQSLGLLTDIQNPYYRSLSIFEQDSNAVSVLEGQDARAIVMHYPR